MTGAFSLAVNGNKRWFPETADIPVLQKRIAVRIVFSQNRSIPIYRLYRPPLVDICLIPVPIDVPVPALIITKNPAIYQT